MSYTLMKGLGWFLAAFVLGIVIGWLLRSVSARRQVARARGSAADAVEVERLRGRVANLETAVAERDRLRAELDQLRPPPSSDSVSTEPEVGGAPDLVAGERVLGREIIADDLKVIPGIGPNVEELCNGIGIRTWFDLSTTEVSLLRTMLADAGPRVGAVDPTSWPELAGLLADGRWAEFEARAGTAQTSPARE